MAGQLMSVEQRDFSEGENPVANPFDLTAKQVVEMINMILDEHGSVRVRDGTQVQGVQSPKGSTLHQIVKIFDLQALVGSTPTKYQTAILLGSGSSGDAPQNNALYLRNTNPWTLIGSFNEVYQTPDVAQFLYKLIIAAGPGETPWTYDGTTLAQVTAQSGQTAPPGAAHLAVHKSYIWLWNTNTTNAASSGPSSLQASDVNTASSWPASNQVFINNGDGQQGMGLGQFTIAESGISPDSTLVAFKEYSTYQVDGVFGASNFSVQRVKTDMGCVAPRTIQFIPGFGIVRLSHRGFALFDGVNDVLISEQERPRIFGRDAYDGIDWANVTKSMAAQLPNPPLYLCACPLVGQTGLPRVFVMDLVRRSWSILTFANTCSTLQQILDSEQIPSVLAGDAQKGYVRQWFNGATSDDGVSVSWLLHLRPVTGKTVNDRFFFRRLLIDTYNMSSVPITALFTWPENTYAVTHTTAPVGGGGYGAEPYGPSPYGAPIGQPASLSYEVLGNVITTMMDIVVSGTGGALGKLRGITWHLRQKPLTRSQSGVW